MNLHQKTNQVVTEVLKQQSCSVVLQRHGTQLKIHNRHLPICWMYCITFSVAWDSVNLEAITKRSLGFKTNKSDDKPGELSSYLFSKGTASDPILETRLHPKTTFAPTNESVHTNKTFRRHYQKPRVPNVFFPITQTRHR